MNILPDSPLFYHQDLAPDVRKLSLSGEEATHAARSRRLVKGDTIWLTNGMGCLGLGTVSGVSHKPLSLQVVLKRFDRMEPPATERVLATAIPKGDRLNTLLDMATQSGMQIFQPLNCHRSTVRPQDRSHDRWRRVIRNSAKQCRQTHFPSIAETRTLEQVLLENRQESTMVVYGEPDGNSIYRATEGIIRPPGKLVMIIGPEGGFDEEETRQLRKHSAIAVHCGSLILRTETAALSLLVSANQWLSDIEWIIRQDNTLP